LSTEALAHDARLGEAWTPFQRAKNFSIVICVRICLFFVGFMPRGVLRAFGRSLGAVANLILRHERKIADQNLKNIFSELEQADRNATIASMFRNLGDDLGDAAHAMTSGRFEPLEISEADKCILQSCVDEGHGVLFVSAHLGPWERVAASIVGAGFPLTTIARESYDPRLTDIYDRLRSRHGVRSIYRGAASAGLRAMRHLKRGGVLGVVMDLNSRVPSTDAPFLGKMARTAIGPARLALRASSRVVVATAAPKENGGLGITITQIVTQDLGRGADGEHTLTTRINDELSRRILSMPDRWVWMHPRWQSSGDEK
jgi:lauroyl/myristoyl acyltransferase